MGNGEWAMVNGREAEVGSQRSDARLAERQRSENRGQGTVGRSQNAECGTRSTEFRVPDHQPSTISHQPSALNLQVSGCSLQPSVFSPQPFHVVHSHNLAAQQYAVLATLGTRVRHVHTQHGANLHVQLVYGEEPHHVSEAIFKALAKALRQAVAVDPRAGKEIPSTKGTL